MKVDVMRRLLFAKFSMPDFREVLVSTCAFRPKADTDSGGKRTPSPAQSGH